ncbi:MAG: hypothetical protein QGF59_12080, partial [Pirellulaceae bacterium]|nr:hypothetical protein [Pirellulaceae bacterium]
MFRSTICASIFVALLFSTLHADDKAEVKRKRLSAQTEKKPAKSQNEPSSKKDKPKASSKPAVKKPNPEKSAPKKSDSKKKLDPAALKKAALAKKQAAEKKAGTTKDSPKKDATKQPVLTIGTDTEYYKSSPAQASAPDGKLKAGTKVYLVKKAGSYTYVKTVDGIAGYVSTDSLKRSDPIKAKKP